MFGQLLHHVGLWPIFAVSAVVLYGVTQVGLFLGRHMRLRLDQPTQAQVTTIATSLLGLLALLLGFAFAMAVNRFESRRMVAIEEVDAIRTAYARSQLLAPDHRDSAARMLRDYVDARIEHLRAGEDDASITAAERRADAILDSLWADAVIIARVTSDEVRTGFYVSSLNDIISDHARRAASLENQVPEIILWLL